MRWIDLGCPIDLDYDPQAPDTRNFGWMLDDNRPTLTLTAPQPCANTSFDRIVIGAHDYYTGLAPGSFTVMADFPINGIPPGENLAPKFKALSPGVWELKFPQPVKALPRSTLAISVKDRQGNETKIERTFSVDAARADATPIRGRR